VVKAPKSFLAFQKKGREQKELTQMAAKFFLKSMKALILILKRTT